MRRLWIVVGVLAALLIAAVVGLNLWVHSYLRSAAFRQLVAAKTGEALRADANYEPFDWSGSSVFSASVTAQGEAGTPLASIEAQQVRANVDWKAIFDGAWRIERLDIVQLDAKIRTESQQAATAGAPGPVPDAPPPKRAFLPSRFELGPVAVQNANVDVGTIGKIRGVALHLQQEGKGWLFDGSGGKLEFPARPTMAIDRFRVRLQQDVVYLTEAALRLGANGTITTSGEIGGAAAPYDIRVEWRNLDAADVLDGAWKERLSGTFSGEAASVGRADKPAQTSGKFRLTDGRLEGLPVQRQIAQFTRSPQFERMPLREVSGDFTTDGIKTTVKNFVAESPGLMRVEGDCRIGANGKLKGEFRVGVTSQALQWLPGSQEKVFRVARGGYLWTDVKIGGSIDKPSEDLSSRLAAAVGEQMIDTGVELMKEAPENASDAVNKAIDLLSPFIR
jgi:hypothetical protein